jgi:hypothetical protein
MVASQVRNTTVLVLVIVLLFPVAAMAGVDNDLQKNLSKSNCIQTWKYNKSAFKLYLNTGLCKENETTAALLTIRYLFESNKAKFPSRIIIYNALTGKEMANYPFKNIPSLMNQ